MATLKYQTVDNFSKEIHVRKLVSDGLRLTNVFGQVQDTAHRVNNVIEFLAELTNALVETGQLDAQFIHKLVEEIDPKLNNRAGVTVVTAAGKETSV